VAARAAGQPEPAAIVKDQVAPLTRAEIDRLADELPDRGIPGRCLMAQSLARDHRGREPPETDQSETESQPAGSRGGCWATENGDHKLHRTRSGSAWSRPNGQRRIV
jgi:hypothetical protein